MAGAAGTTGAFCTGLTGVFMTCREPSTDGLPTGVRALALSYFSRT